MFDSFIILLLMSFTQLCVHCRFRHVSDGLVSLHTFFPRFPTKLLHGDTVNSARIQTVWRNTCGENNSNKRQPIDSHTKTCSHFQHSSFKKINFFKNKKYAQFYKILCEHSIYIFYIYQFGVNKNEIVWSKHSRMLK